ncbi:hypothetical protein CC78DRAFT_618471 [Lojkania enalia]|uniref:Uncharacterized protein n=1 Tax=Lojkania enalia TaxID=147567 RepID=A0A9P4N1P5_9PLEO|nr:hypothetical protein CC78DRAFT_618471 [Didymosphaeria enalia]
MIFSSRSILSAFLVSSVAFAASNIQLKPINDPSELTSGHFSKRDAPDGLTLLPIEDPGVLTHGHSLKREVHGNDVFNPTSQRSFFWGAYASNTIYTANFTLHNEDEDEYILAIEDFARRLKSINCGSASAPFTIEFNDKPSFKYAKYAWEWVNKEDENKFTLVTKPNQCYYGDDRTPYLVSDINFDESKLLAKLTAKERPWGEVAHTFRLTLNHEVLDPDTVNVTHPHLMHMKRATKTMDLSHSFNQNLFKFNKGGAVGEIDVSADASITTGGQIIADLDIEYKWFIPTDLKINIRPQGVNAEFLLSLQADGRLGNPIDWALKPEIEIPVGALNIKGILEIGPFVTMGVHYGSTALEGTARASIGARATIDDSATVDVKLRHPSDNRISGWTPHFEKIDPTFSAQIGGNVKAWAELGIQIKAEALGRWGYQASVDAQLPYFEATFAAKADSNGVCGTPKAFGVDLGANVGINVNLNAGEVDESPSFQKDLFQTSWPLFSTCLAFGPDVGAPTPSPELPSSNLVAPTSVIAAPTLAPSSVTPTSGIIESTIAQSSEIVSPSVLSSVLVDEPIISSVADSSVASSAIINPTDLSSIVIDPTALPDDDEGSLPEPSDNPHPISTGSSLLPSTTAAALPNNSDAPTSTKPGYPVYSPSKKATTYKAPIPTKSVYPIYSPSSSKSTSSPCKSKTTLKTSVKTPVSTNQAYPVSSSVPSYNSSTRAGYPIYSSTPSSTYAPIPTNPEYPVYSSVPIPSSTHASASNTPAYPIYSEVPSSSDVPLPSTPAYPVYSEMPSSTVESLPNTPVYPVYSPSTPESSAYTPEPPVYSPEPPLYSSEPPEYTSKPPVYTPPTYDSYRPYYGGGYRPGRVNYRPF